MLVDVPNSSQTYNIGDVPVPGRAPGQSCGFIPVGLILAATLGASSIDGRGSGRLTVGGDD